MYLLTSMYAKYWNTLYCYSRMLHALICTYILIDVPHVHIAYNSKWGGSLCDVWLIFVIIDCIYKSESNMELQRDDDGFCGTFQCSHTTEMIDGVKTRLCSRLFPCR